MNRLITFYFFLSIPLKAMDIPFDYNDFSALEKQDCLWAKVNEHQYEHQLPELFNWFEKIISSVNSSDKIGFQEIGPVAKFRFVSRSKYYSGLYSSGALGFIRFSFLSNSTAAVSLKFLIDDSSSIGIKFVKPLKSKSFGASYFAQEFICDATTAKRIAKRLNRGRLEFNVKAPSKLKIVPSNILIDVLNSEADEDFRSVITSNIINGAILFTVWAYDADLDREFHISDIVAESEFISSRFVDEVMFK